MAQLELPRVIESSSRFGFYNRLIKPYPVGGYLGTSSAVNLRKVFDKVLMLSDFMLVGYDSVRLQTSGHLIHAFSYTTYRGAHCI